MPRSKVNRKNGRINKLLSQMKALVYIQLVEIRTDTGCISAKNTHAGCKASNKKKNSITNNCN